MRLIYDISRCGSENAVLIGATRLLRALSCHIDVSIVATGEMSEISDATLDLFLGRDVRRVARDRLAAAGRPRRWDAAIALTPAFDLEMAVSGGPSVVRALTAGVDRAVFYPCPGVHDKWDIRRSDHVGLAFLPHQCWVRQYIVKLIGALTESRRLGVRWTLVCKVAADHGRLLDLTNELVGDAVRSGTISRRWWNCVQREGSLKWLEEDLDLDEMRNLYNTVDFLIKPGSSSTTGAAISEATACGVPTITGSLCVHPGNALVNRLPLSRSPAGEVYPPSAMDLAEAVLNLKARRNNRNRQRGIQYAQTTLSWDSLAREIVGILRLLQASRGVGH